MNRPSIAIAVPKPRNPFAFAAHQRAAGRHAAAGGRRRQAQRDLQRTLREALEPDRPPNQ